MTIFRNKETLVHEYTHIAEGSEDYAKMLYFLQSDDILSEVQTEDGKVERIPLWQKAQAAVMGKDYGFDENKINVISEKINSNNKLTSEETKIYKAFLTEITAHETQYLLGTEEFIDKIIATDRTFARKIIDKVFNLKEALAKVEDKSTAAQLKLLRKAEKLYLKAAQKAGDAQLVKYMLSRSEELKKELDNDTSIVYNKRKKARYIPYNKVGNDVIHHIRTELKKIYNNFDGVADVIAIEYGNNVYIVDSGNENGNVTFGVLRKVYIKDAVLRAEFIRSNNNDAVSKRYVSNELSSKFGSEYVGGRGRNMRRKSGEELSVDQGEPQHNQGRVSEDNADRRRGILSTSLDEEIRYELKEKDKEKRGRQRTSYSQYYTLAMQWAFSSNTKPGDRKSQGVCAKKCENLQTLLMLHKNNTLLSDIMHS